MIGWGRRGEKTEKPIIRSSNQSFPEAIEVRVSLEVTHPKLLNVTVRDLRLKSVE